MAASRRMDRIASHLTDGNNSHHAGPRARSSADDVVIVDAIRTPITRAKRVRCTLVLLMAVLRICPVLA